ncbi:aldehyde dehydrogenase (NADP(+)) [Rhodococcus koreensis]|uniref:NADP-dependent aldehyde dehydrogenase n=1 Tax=Rhodococcus koreensis TaxID=99653 RepID=A0A1H4X691_9NOCA|nr:aldehyde dehydrogenase (NADP(+)) [Rhodococcus koreensis]SED00418.1 NADP-dependent aldehyde dehydrogenase [Rhodococcus koreensis]
MTDTTHSIEPDTTDAQLDRLLDAAAAAAPLWEDRTPHDRAAVLVAIADALEAHADGLVAEAIIETGLPQARLSGELNRTCVQLRMFAEELIDGTFLDVIIDRADPDFVLGARPDLRRYQIPVGPVLVFAASNFPFAFSVAGTDTASALAAGCPVVLKAHPGHPRTSAATADVVAGALSAAGAPDGTFALISGFRAGTRALEDPRIAAAAFTGSVAGGRALFDIAAARPNPIPFFGELGSVNPAVVTAGALDERAEAIASGFVGSFTLGAGQFCTKPGILLVPAGSPITDQITTLAQQVPAARMLTAKIAEGYHNRIEEAAAAPGVEVLVKGTASTGESGVPEVTPTLLRTTAEQLVAQADTLLEESFGPAAIIAEYGTEDEVNRVLNGVDGTLTVTVHTRTEPTPDEREQLRSLTRIAATRAGRLVFNGWPTGVAVTPAQHHGGPYPATTAVSHTSVGTTAIRRFLRPVTYQDAPEVLLPAPIQERNPLAIPRTVNSAGQSSTWGRAQS